MKYEKWESDTIYLLSLFDLGAGFTLVLIGLFAWRADTIIAGEVFVALGLIEKKIGLR